MNSDSNGKDGSPESLSKSIEDYDISTNNSSPPDFNGTEDINSDSYDSIWLTNGSEENERKRENYSEDINDEFGNLFVDFPNKIDDTNISKLDSQDYEDKANGYPSYRKDNDQPYSKLKCWAYFCIGWGIVFGCIIGGTVIIIYDQNMRKRLMNSSGTPTISPSPLMTISPSLSKIPSPLPSISTLPSTTHSALPSSLPSISLNPTITGLPSTSPTFYSNYPTFMLPFFDLSNKPSAAPILSSPTPSLQPTQLNSLFPSIHQTISPSNLSNSPSMATSDVPTLTNSKSPSYSPSTIPSNSDNIIVASVKPSNHPTLERQSNSPTINTSVSPSYSPTFITHSSFKPSNEPSTERDQIRAAYLPILETISDPSDLIDPTTSQYQAADWIIFHDELNLQPNDVGLLQRYALATFYFATTSDKNGNDVIWNKCGASSVAKNNRCDIDRQTIVYPFFSKFSECSWFGITCDETTGHINAIDISNNNLRGTLPAELFSLESLLKLNLSRNLIYGQIPIQISYLTKLRTFHLSRNELTGFIPSEFGSLPDIHRIHIANNFLQGTIPNEMFSSNLKFLDLGGNDLIGSIPDQIYDSRILQHIDISSNALTGTISASFGTELKKLTTLLLGDNYFTGTLPEDLFSNKEKDGFKYLNFGLNLLKGKIPQSLFNETNVIYFDVGANELTGTLSSSFGKLIELEQLVLWSNQFTGTVPSEMSNMLQLEMLHLAQNNLMGSIPSAVCSLAQKDSEIFAVNSVPVIDISADCGGDVPLIRCDCCTICLNETVAIARRGPL